MAIDIGDTPTGTPPNAGEKLQMATALGLGTTDSPAFLAITLGAGDVTNKALVFGSSSHGFWSVGAGTAIRYGLGAIVYLGVSSNGLELSSGQYLGIGGSPGLGGADVRLYRDAAGTFYQRNGINAQNFWLANTYIDAANYERAVLGWTANVLRIGTENLGTGVARAINFVTGGTVRGGINAAGGYFQTLLASITPASNGDYVVEATSNTSITIKLKGSDAVVRSVVLTLA